jgi:hypothetical protein
MFARALGRNSLSNSRRLAQMTRGGGWDRPDVPLRKPYEVRRKVSAI